MVLILGIYVFGHNTSKGFSHLGGKKTPCVPVGSRGGKKKVHSNNSFLVILYIGISFFTSSWWSLPYSEFIHEFKTSEWNHVAVGYLVKMHDLPAKRPPY